MITFTLSTPLWFGKYKGKTIEQILIFDCAYIRWVMDEFEPERYDFADDVIEALLDCEQDPLLDSECTDF